VMINGRIEMSGRPEDGILDQLADLYLGTSTAT
jgi:hypothetical protein